MYCCGYCLFNFFPGQSRTLGGMFRRRKPKDRTNKKSLLPTLETLLEVYYAWKSCLALVIFQTIHFYNLTNHLALASWSKLFTKFRKQRNPSVRRRWGFRFDVLRPAESAAEESRRTKTQRITNEERCLREHCPRRISQGTCRRCTRTRGYSYLEFLFSDSLITITMQYDCSD